MKRPINIHQRYRKPLAWFDSYGTAMSAITAVLGASHIGVLSSQVGTPQTRIVQSVLSTAISIMDIQKGSMMRRFKATKRYVR